MIKKLKRALHEEVVDESGDFGEYGMVCPYCGARTGGDFSWI